MGMYTEAVFKIRLKDELPDDVVAVLDFLFNQANAPKSVPSHKFFSCTRWVMIGNGSSYYHVPFSMSKFDEGRIFSRFDLKNYDGEIGEFVSWIRQYVDDIPGSVIGWEWYEEDSEPTLIRI